MHTPSLYFRHRNSGKCPADSAFPRKFFRLPLLGFVFMTAAALFAQMVGPADSVNPLIGTGRGPGGSINLFPGPTLPFGMVQLSPDTENHGYGYHDFQHSIQGFSMTHLSGVGCANEGDVFFTATTGPIHTQVSDFQSSYSHSQETAEPGYYRVRLSRWDINAELTATNRAGIARFSFPAGKPANILVPISHTLNDTIAAHVRVVGDRQIDGYVVNRIFCGNRQTYKIYFAMHFNRPFSSFGTWGGTLGEAPETLATENRVVSQTSQGQWIGAYATWPTTTHPQAITVQIGISYVDLAGAENNVHVEAAGKSFATIRRQARAKWNQTLDVINISGGTPTSRTVFYTALYHSLLMPSIFSDSDRRYIGFDGKVHHAPPGHLIYANYSGWDIYRSQMPLLALIEPRRMEDMAQSIVQMYQQGGWIGRWPQINHYTNIMAGSPLTTVLCTAWLDGLHGFDIGTAWQGMLLDATQAPPKGRPYTGQAGMEWINKVHYVPNDKIRYGSVSQIQEDAIADASLYRLAIALGKTNDAKMLYRRALYVRNVFDPEDGFFRPRNANGEWVQGFDPAHNGHGFIEGSGWHYQWLAPSDMAWLIQVVGRDRFNRRLTDFFDYKTPGWYPQYYNPYNETDLEAPFEFNFSGKPWESQRVVRRALTETYTESPDGVPGNDDAGAMSSWGVMGMMGIYSIDPASLAYELVSPLFPRIVVHLHAPYPGKTFVIQTSANPETTPYIQQVQWNSHPYRRNWIAFQDIRRGGTLHFQLGDSPNESWGASVEDAPLSLSTKKF
jgi:predicted alpha-1,2-mannosidase